ncbi:hypothetical protein PPACK8108_LOCUS1694 [Phakopsora pachyrhizi]|uniref:Uncharacterized protein n=1 Tax=Phakopsora pachyrhizi TaxID=170000 RepID=A0AAV0AI80_PHAPC|nr:hypothetical protein PPACK8108_LOCUS1694 [Phakopsora pachyrhizi]
MAKDFLEHLGEFTDSDYNFFDRYISTSPAELEDEMIEGCNSFAKDFVDPRYRKSLLLQAGISASQVEHAIVKLKSKYSKSIRSLSVQHEESFSSQLSHSPQSLSIESQLLNDFQMVEAMPQGSYDDCLTQKR